MTTELQQSPVLLAVGQLFLDLVFTDLPEAVSAGREVRAGSFASGPGGIANQAITAARLGATTAMAAWIGDDPFGTLCGDAVAREGVDVGACRVQPGWAQPVTVAIADGDDRAMVTGGAPAPSVEALFPLRRIAPWSAIADLGSDAGPWIEELSDAGTGITATIGWDVDGDWDPAALDALEHCAAFIPNAEEATRYTRRDDPVEAARALAERVPLAVVTLGGMGVVAVDSGSGTEVRRPALDVPAIDATGAGDVFCAAFTVSGVTGWSLLERVDFAALIAAIAVTAPGGAAAAPTAAAIVPWLDAHPQSAAAGRFDFVRRAFAADAPNPFTVPSFPS